MTATTKEVEVKLPGVTLSRLIWQTFRKQPVGYIEKVMEANPGIERHIILPIGTTVTMPVDSLLEDPQTNQTIRLWD